MAADAAYGHGLLPVDKPVDWTSHDVVNFVRRFGFGKVGHCGTLDPAATGLLLLLVGRRATRHSNHFSGHDKTYDACIRLGVETDTQDREGEVTRTAATDAVDPEHVTDVCRSFVGDGQQIPPMTDRKSVV